MNDAPALRRADVGIAVHGATAAAQSSADIVLAQPGLGTVVQAVLARGRRLSLPMTHALGSSSASDLWCGPDSRMLRAVWQPITADIPRDLRSDAQLPHIPHRTHSPGTDRCDPRPSYHARHDTEEKASETLQTRPLPSSLNSPRRSSFFSSTGPSSSSQRSSTQPSRTTSSSRSWPWPRSSCSTTASSSPSPTTRQADRFCVLRMGSAGPKRAQRRASNRV